jgi:hypothetical protein
MPVETAGYYAWACKSGCLPTLITAVRLEEDLAPFERAALVARDTKPTTSLLDLLDSDQVAGWEPSGPHDFVFLAEPLDPACIPGVKIYMPFILYHYIECAWGPCYSSLFANVIRPHLESVEVLEYVLRSPVVRDDTGQHTLQDGPKMYRELYDQLSRVRSPDIRRYLADTFGSRYTSAT